MKQAQQTQQLQHAMIDSHQRKRMRAGSISGRLRAASDLEDAGLIDKHQKGYIKDLIISGDPVLQDVLDKYEKGEKAPLEELIRGGTIGRRQSIDLLDELDFDFLNALTTDGELDDPFNDFYFDAHDPAISDPLYQQATAVSQSATAQQQASDDHPRRRNSSVDSAASLNSKMFDNIAPYLLAGSNLQSSSGTSSGDRTKYDAMAMANIPADYTQQFRQSLVQRRQNQFEQPAERRGSGGTAAIDYEKTNTELSKALPRAQNELYPPMNLTRGERKVGSKKKMTPRNSLVSADGLDLLIGGGEDLSTLLAGSSEDPSLFTSWNDNFMPPAVPSIKGASGVTNPGAVQERSAASASSSVAEVAISGSSTKASASGTERRLPGYIGAYTPEERRQKIEKFLDKRTRRVWTKKVKYDVRKNFADSRLRIKGRFVKKEDEDVMREILSM